MERALITTFLKRHVLQSAMAVIMLGSSFLVQADEAPLNKVVAVVDSNVILESDVQQAIDAAKQQLSQHKQTTPPDDILRSEVLNQLILKEAQLERVKRAGITIDENTLNAALTDVAKQNGANSLKEFQARVDAHAPGTYAKLRQQVADDISIGRLRQQQVSARIKVSEQDVDNFLNSPESASLSSGSEVHLVHVRIGMPAKANSKQIQQAKAIADAVRIDLQSKDDIQSVVTKNQNKAFPVDSEDMGWRQTASLPKALTAQLSSLSQNETSNPARGPDGFHIIKLIDRRNSDQKTIITQYKVRHILIRPTEVVSPADAKQKIDQLYTRIKNGENFAELASTFSNDPGSANAGGDLGWVSAGMMVPEFEAVMKKTPVGKVSDPFETPYGWHILQVEDTRQQDVTEQTRRNNARQILAERQFNQEVDSWLREVRSQSYVEVKDDTPIN